MFNFAKANEVKLEAESPTPESPTPEPQSDAESPTPDADWSAVWDDEDLKDEEFDEDMTANFKEHSQNEAANFAKEQFDCEPDSEEKLQFGVDMFTLLYNYKYGGSQA